MSIISIPTSVGGVALPGQLGQVTSGPLAALFGNSKALTTLNYPSELSTDATKMHYVQFGIKEIQPATYDSSVKQQGVNFDIPGSATIGALSQNATAASVGTFASNATMKGAGLIDGLVNSVTGNNNNPSLGNGLTNLHNNLSTGIAITPPVTELKAYISLYMPDTINNTLTNNWSDVSFRDALGSRGRTLRSIDAIAAAATKGFNSGSGFIDTFVKTISAASSDPNAIKAITDAAETFTGGSHTSDILLQAHGYAVNPQLQMLYTGTSLRTFQLTFNFTPKSQKEADVVKSILFTFKYYSSPALQNGTSSSSQSMFLIPPSIFSVKFMQNGIENDNLPKYADCVLDSMDVNHTPNGFAAHTDGSPIQTQLTLTFKEIELVEKGRLSKGYINPSNDKGLR